MSKFFEQLKEGLEEVLAHKEGKITLRSEMIEIPEPPASYTAHSIKKIRTKRPKAIRKSLYTGQQKVTG